MGVFVGVLFLVVVDACFSYCHCVGVLVGLCFIHVVGWFVIYVWRCFLCALVLLLLCVFVAVVACCGCLLGVVCCVCFNDACC